MPESYITAVLVLVPITPTKRMHSAIRYLTPNDRHARRDVGILAARHRVYRAAYARTPRHWTRQTRNWTPIGAVALNPVNTEPRLANCTRFRRQLS